MRFSTQGLSSAGMDLTAPFSVLVQLAPHVERAPGIDRDILVETSVDMHFEDVLRVLPGRRCAGIARVAQATGGLDIDQPYFVKIFYGEGARRYWQRELTGASYFAKAGVPRAQVLASGNTEDGQGFVVVYELLPQAQSVDPNNSQHIENIVQILAQLHAAGFVQTDVHLNNFVLSQQKVYAVDADGARSVRLLRQQFTNLALFFAQRSADYDGQVVELWHLYANKRGEYVQKMGSANQLLALTKQQRRARIAKYLKKTQRECSEFVHRKRWQRETVCEREYWPLLQHFTVFPEEYMQQGEVLKLGNSSTVVRIKVDGHSLIVKRYNIKNALHRIRRWFKRRARNAWCNGHHLAFIDLPTAKPIALVESRFGWFVGVSYLVMPDCGTHTLLDQVHNWERAGQDYENQFADVAKDVVALLEKLRAAHLVHGDLKATNLIITEDGVKLIDYDALARTNGGQDSLIDVHRFMQNWVESPTQEKWQRRLEDAGLLR